MSNPYWMEPVSEAELRLVNALALGGDGMAELAAMSPEEVRRFDVDRARYALLVLVATGTAYLESMRLDGVTIPEGDDEPP